MRGLPLIPPQSSLIAGLNTGTDWLRRASPTNSSRPGAARCGRVRTFAPPSARRSSSGPHTYAKFYTDLQMFTTTMGERDPGVIMRPFNSWEAATKDNKWQGRNITHWPREEYDKHYQAAASELNPVKRAALFVAMNDLVVGECVILPVVYRPRVSAMLNQPQASLSDWTLICGI